MKDNLLKYNLQYFADGGKDDSAEDTGDNKSDGTDDKAGEEKKFTQADIDNAVKERLAREKKKAEKTQSATIDKTEPKAADKGADENDKKLTALEEKVLCYDHDIAKEYSKEAIALAKAYLDEDTDMDGAIEKVVKKFPMFAKGFKAKDEDEDEEDPKSWGDRQKGTSKKVDAVEEAFMKRNGGLKI